MARFATTPVVHPVNRLIDLFPPPVKQLDRPGRAPPELKQVLPEEDRIGALACLVVAPLLTLGVVALWPMVFVAIVLLLVAVTPFVVVGAGMRAILRH
jgi:hypothetical protein